MPARKFPPCKLQLNCLKLIIRACVTEKKPQIQCFICMFTVVDSKKKKYFCFLLVTVVLSYVILLYNEKNHKWVTSC